MRKRHVLLQPVISFLLIVVVCELLIVPLPAATAVNEVQVEYFYDTTCSKCAKAAPVIEDVAGRYGNVNLTLYDIRSFYSYAQQYGITLVPAVVVNRNVVITYEDYNGDTGQLENLLVEAIENPHESIVPAGPLRDAAALNNSFVIGKSHLLVFVAGLLAGFNPCLLAVMAFLSSVILSSNGSRRDMLTLVLGFCTGIFATYMIVGIGVLNTVNSFPSIQDIINKIMVSLIFILGMWHLFDAYHMKTHKRTTFRTPASFIRFMGGIKGRNVILLSFVTGAAFSLIKAPCVGAVYLAILDMLISGSDLTGGIIYLGIYNLGVVLPILVLGGMLSLGLDPEKVSDFKERKRVEIRFITGITLILLAVLLQLNMI